ncbi:MULTISPECIES: type II toxin-antitoxin system VapC family toxin [unclassified Bradyrhizobium]|uniref:type II toxin-antitoxin system VapC family toxin n=1 Tax=unclassified Bradyrhizobium TaxID=2631580 RepID=UPI000368D26C|nr:MULTISPECIES: type II toxin-antitoxin system VapC family toxin [unclassified Bradyrhizobium]MBB4258496.1 putative nucleic-acid-binding protein [Bradyrhizobium sp. CIR3A]MBB4365965.1 putative nucleic-acid-binding protein [Bradyrhizobium sp. CIR18]MBB4398082.1 putative nucleic-acid-binding protein [Bradyrhizobium sp. ERR14]MBB4426491.1 putative nucleic-acid-binding protein [Bradyrhizobium sp. CIR48]
MKITPDTNVLVRVLVGDDAEQSKVAEALLKKADLIAISIPALCELAWVLSRGYKTSAENISASIRHLINASNAVVDRPAAEAGLSFLDAGGDFADGVIAHEGNWLGADTFVSFDRKAVKLIEASGGLARLAGTT